MTTEGRQEEPFETVDSASKGNRQDARKRYFSPELRVHGKVDSLTRGGSYPGAEATFGGNPIYAQS